MTEPSTTTRTAPATPNATTPPDPCCPAWCTDHDGFDDGSGDWHRSTVTTVGNRIEFYVSTGTFDGSPELYVDVAPESSLTLDEAEALAAAMLAAVRAVRA